MRLEFLLTITLYVTSKPIPIPHDQQNSNNCSQFPESNSIHSLTCFRFPPTPHLPLFTKAHKKFCPDRMSRKFLAFACQKRQNFTTAKQCKNARSGKVEFGEIRGRQLVRVCREHVLRVIFEWGRMRHTHWFCFPSLDCNC